MTMTRAHNLSYTAVKLRPTTALTDSTESLLLDDMTAGNPVLEDLGVLFRDHYKGMFRVSYRITGSESDAEDVLQTIFLRLAPGWSERDLSPNPRAFLYRAAINASLDIVRSRKRANAV